MLFLPRDNRQETIADRRKLAASIQRQNLTMGRPLELKICTGYRKARQVNHPDPAKLQEGFGSRLLDSLPMWQNTPSRPA
jgi:hypothetical protein